MDTMQEWLTTFWLILSKPTPSTFRKVARYAPGKFPSAVAWLALIGGLSFAYLLIGIEGQLSLNLLIFLGIIVYPLMILFWVTAIYYFYSRVFHRKKDLYDECLFIVAACNVLMLSLAMLFWLLPGTISLVLGWVALGYLVILVVVGVRAITGLKIWQSIVAVVCSIFCAGVFTLCAMLMVGRLPWAVWELR